MKTVERQLAVYFETQDQAYGPIAPSEVTVQTATPVGDPSPSSLIWVWVAAAAVVFIAVGFVGVLAIRSERSAGEFVDSPTPTTFTPDAGDVVDFNGRTFSFDEGGPADSPYRLVEQEQSGDWTPVEGFNFEYPVSITTSEDRIMVVSPSASANLREPCDDVVVDVAVSGDGETWRRTILDDLGPDIARQSTIYGPRMCRTMGSHLMADDGYPADGPDEGRWLEYDHGGDAVGPSGMLIVRLITTPWADPGYPHFWYSPDGIDWQWIDLPTVLQWAEGQPDPPDNARHWDISTWRWGTPEATIDGFAIDIEVYNGESWETSETWVSSDGRTWTLDEAGS